MSKQTLLPPALLAQADVSWSTALTPSANADDPKQQRSIVPILSHLLLLPISPTLETLSQQTLSAILELEASERPDTYEGLLDVARYCIDEEPGWEENERWNLIAQRADLSVRDTSIASSSGAGASAAGGMAELPRLEEEMWDGATRRASELVKLAQAGQMVDAVPARVDRESNSSANHHSARPSHATQHETFDEPLIALSHFTKLISQSDILCHFFKEDFPSSFRLEAAVRAQETPREALATLAAVAVTGGGGGTSTAKRVRGLLGGLLGEVGDRVGKATGRETRYGPKASFVGLQNASRIELEKLEKGFDGKNARMAKGVKSSNASSSNSSSSNGTLLGRTSTTHDTSTLPSDAEERVKAAAAALVAREEGAFVIDEARDGEDDEEGATELELGEEEEEELELGLETGGTSRGGAVLKAQQADAQGAKQGNSEATRAQKRIADGE